MRNCDCSSPNGGTPLKAPKKSASMACPRSATSSRSFASERGHAIEGAEEVGFDRGPRRPLTQHRRGVEGEVDAGVSDVAVEDPLVDAGLIGRRGGDLGILALPEGAEQPTVVEHRRADEAADSERLSLTELDHLLS